MGRGDRRRLRLPRPSNNANGNTRDRQGRLVTCEHDSRRVTRTEYDGSITVLADSYEGKQLNSPNDVVVKARRRDLVHRSAVRDPRLLRGPQGRSGGGAGGLPARPAVRRVSVVTDEVAGPNGLAFSPDERPRTSWHRAPSRTAAPRLRRDRRRHEAGEGPGVHRCRPAARPTASASTSTAICGAAGAWAAPELDGVRDVQLRRRADRPHRLPERCANLCFGGRYRNRLFMAASHGLYSLYVNTQGAPGG